MAHRLIKNGDLVLNGPVGGSFFSETGFSDNDVIEALTELEGDITVRINSGGGSAFQGIGIFNALKAHDGKVTVAVDGIAASAASIIAMAGEDIVMREGAMMMIHNASGMTAGTKETHAKTIKVLERLDGQMAGVYAKRSGMSKSKAQALMDEETWLTGAEAVKKGLATKTDSEPAATASQFDYAAYSRAPQHLVAQAATFTAQHTGTKQAERPGPIATPAPAAEQGTRTMDFKDITLSGLRENRADLVTEIEATMKLDDKLAAARAEGAKAERERIKGIEDNTLPGHEKLTAELKFDGKTSPAEAAVAILKAEKALGGRALTGIG
jgi:ATP-dependent Clp protease protease subunit